MLKSAPRFMITTHIPDCDCLFIRAHHDAAYIERTFLVIFLAVSAGRALTPMVRLDRYRQLALPYTSGSEPSSVLKLRPLRRGGGGGGGGGEGARGGIDR